MAATIDHIEQALADAYRKEIDQEDNVWRTLPFFAATIAFEMTALAQTLTRLPENAAGAWWDAVVAIVILSLLVFVAMFFLMWSIAPATFRYVSDEPRLLQYARDLDGDEQDAAARGLDALDALAVLKGALADQYAVATHHNRQINHRRAFHRSVAGMATLVSVVFTMFLVTRLLLHYIPHGS